MNTQTFFRRLLAVAAMTAAALAMLHFLVPAAQTHWKLAVGAIVLFVLICLGLFFIARNAARSRDRLAFNSVISLSVFGKMITSIAFLFAYQKMAKPVNEWFVAIFLLTYVAFTVFEVWFMTKLAKG